MNMRSFLRAAGVLMVIGAAVHADEAKAPALADDMARLLKASGAVSYARNASYGAGIDEMTIGYGEDGKPVVGLATRKTKTYAEALAVVAVTPKDGAYTIAAAEIPTITTFHGKSQDLAKGALKEITGRIFKDAKDARSLADATTGATQYYKAIYVSYALMASKIIEELSANPDWPRTTLQP
jgi:hypothetical protein